jgi:hypothetical protein
VRVGKGRHGSFLQISRFLAFFLPWLEPNGKAGRAINT